MNVALIVLVALVLAGLIGFRKYQNLQAEKLMREIEAARERARPSAWDSLLSTSDTRIRKARISVPTLDYHSPSAPSYFDFTDRKS